jgi:hypothetical protein
VADPNCATIQAAVNAASSGDTVQVAAGVYAEHVTVGKDLTISGAGAAQTVVDGTQSGRVFNIGGTVTLSGMTVTNGETSGDGGGIFNSGTLAVTNCIISNNSAGSDGGGGINNDTGILTLTDSIVSNNSALNGGGILNSTFLPNKGITTITNSIVSGNFTIDDGGTGGGIFNSTGTLNIINSTISNNSINNSINTNGVGGGICNANEGTLNVTGSTFNNNLAGFGGGIYNTNATMTVTGSTFSNNAARFGGGIYNGYTTSVTSSTFSGNSGNGGGINTNGPLTITSSIIAGNTTTTSGPDLRGTFTSHGHNLVGKSDGSTGFASGTNGDIVGTIASPVDAKLSSLGFYGGPTQTQLPLCGSPAIDAGDDAVTGAPLNLTADQRGAARKAGAHVDIGAVERQQAQVNSADAEVGSLRQLIADAQDGGVIDLDPCASATTVTLTSGELLIDKNLTINGPGADLMTVQRGGGLGTPNFRIFTIGSGRAVTISGLTVSRGNGFNGDGGGILNNGGILNLTNVTVSNNSAFYGGGIYNAGAGTLIVTNSTISMNSSIGDGGGIFNDSGVLTVTNSAVNSNSTRSSGGGIYNNDGAATVTNSTVGINSAGSNGGGLYSGNGSLAVTNSMVSGNSALGNGGGGGIYNGSGTLAVTSSTIIGNASSEVGSTGGIANFAPGGSAVKLWNSIVALNTAPDLSGVFTSLGHNLIGASDGTNGLTNGTNGDIVGTVTAPVNPQLFNNGDGTRPLPSSPAVDAGDDAVLGPPFNLATDLRGLPRKVGAHVDIGAFEVNYSFSATAGDSQSAQIKTAFAKQLQTTVKESGKPVTGVTVTFTAPASGASGTFDVSGTNVVAVTSNSVLGAVAPIYTANGTAGGPYNVVASIGAGAPPVSFSLTNLKGDQTVNFRTLPNKTFGDADFQLSATATSGLAVSYTASGQCAVSGSTVHITGAGSCTITASQPGDSNYNPAADAQQSFQIAKASTATALSSSANPSATGQSVTFTATVSSPAGTPAGTVTFKDGGTAISTCSNVLISSGQATCATSALSTGGHTITAEYSGDANFSISSGALSVSQVVAATLFNFSQATYTVNERDGSITITVSRTGDTTQAASVDYSTDDGSTPSVFVRCSSVTGIALERCDYTRAAGTLNFAAGETQKTFAVLVNDDSYVEGTETASLRLSNPVGALLGQQSSATLQITDDTQRTTNPVDDSQFFVTQHYHDFLNREPDSSGLQFWANQMTNCTSPPPADLTVCHVNVSAAFFLSIEFQQTGYLVERMYKTAYGDATGNSTLGGAHQLGVPVVRLDEFLRDTQEVESTPTQVIVGQGNWQQQLEDNKNAFALDFVQRQRFTNAFPSTLTADAFVNQLNTNAGGVMTASDISQLDGIFGGPSASSNDPAKRAQALRAVAENATLKANETNRAFVLMQYFGYLRRNPDDAPDADYTGYDFWLTKLNQFNGNFVQAEMVKAFITSAEYRQRFGQ